MEVALAVGVASEVDDDGLALVLVDAVEDDLIEPSLADDGLEGDLGDLGLLLILLEQALTLRLEVLDQPIHLVLHQDVPVEQAAEKIRVDDVRDDHLRGLHLGGQPQRHVNGTLRGLRRIDHQQHSL